MLRKKRYRVVCCNSNAPGYERHGSHHVTHESGLHRVAVNKSHVAVGDDSKQHIVWANNGKTGYSKLAAEPVDVRHRGVGSRRHGVRDHSRFASFDLVDVPRLVVNGQIPVDDAHATLSSHPDGHARFGHSVHRARDDRRKNGDVASESRRRVSLARNDVRVSGKKHHVVVCQSREPEWILCNHGHPFPWKCTLCVFLLIVARRYRWRLAEFLAHIRRHGGTLRVPLTLGVCVSLTFTQ